MKICIVTDMEGLAGVNHWNQCYATDDHAPEYLHGLAQLAADTNATIAGCFDAGATEVIVWDGHGRNRQQAFTRVALDPRATLRRMVAGAPLLFEGLDAATAGVLMVGQHAMAGTLHGYLDHTQCTKEICRFLINGAEHGEMSQCALHAGAFGVPLLHVSGDEALCDEARRLFPWVASTPTKRGTGWATCELYPVDSVRAAIRRDVATAIGRRSHAQPWQPAMPAEVAVEFGWSELADKLAAFPGVRRQHARTVAWHIPDARYIYDWPSAAWQPPQN
ncbi:MAG: M55 family metallopeptidase [Opitutaceae bacterium]|nr:M55 family metallopeptidase [Opitutaceae bacterium]MBP9911970.1 M55 family metallopeptidase [Opitutaceae bacterium]